MVGSMLSDEVVLGTEWNSMKQYEFMGLDGLAAYVAAVLEYKQSEFSSLLSKPISAV